ncbi:MAG: hypothetical protein K2X86_09375 [Cytophagaceae bacterium]|nr:hypothetical protein [Cytophagaceae bacterium]
MTISSDFKELFRTKSGCIYQCDKDLCFYVEFAGHLTPYKFACFLALKKLIDKIDLASMICNSENCCDMEIVNPCGSDRIYVLSLPQIIEFKELLAGGKAMLQLNSILKERLHVAMA